MRISVGEKERAATAAKRDVESIAESLRGRLKLVEERAEASRVRVEEMESGHAKLQEVERAAETSRREAAAESELLRKRAKELEERIKELEARIKDLEAHKEEPRSRAALCGELGLEEETARVGKRVVSLEASISWLHAEFASLHAEFVTLCDDAEDANKRSGRAASSSA